MMLICAPIAHHDSAFGMGSECFGGVHVVVVGGDRTGLIALD